MSIYGWGSKDRFLFYMTALLLYIYPLILADYYYIDDSYRASAGVARWISEGRGLIEVFYNALSFSSGIPNSFPLALLIACGGMALALSSLAHHYFGRVDFSNALVVLPLWFSPFFLTNLSYQYDGPLMALGVAAVICSITIKLDNWWCQKCVGVLLVSASLAIYQPIVNVLLGLWCIEVFRQLLNGERLIKLVMFLVGKLIELTIALACYLGISYPFVVGDRQELLPLDSVWGEGVFIRFQHLFERVEPLFMGAHFWLFIALGVLAVIACVAEGGRLLKATQSGVDKLGAVFVFLTIPLMLLWCVLGVMSVLKLENTDSRVLVGSACSWVFVFFVINRFFSRVHRWGGLILVVPLLFMLSLSYSYGRLLSDKKELESSIVYSLVHSISVDAQLRAVGKFYFRMDAKNYWLPAAEGTTSVMPIMPYLLASDFLLLSEKLVRSGITNMKPPVEAHFSLTVLGSNPQPVIESIFYSIYVHEGDGYIVMKRMKDLRGNN